MIKKLCILTGLLLMSAMVAAQFAEVTWEAVDGADGYVVRKYNAFTGALISADTVGAELSFTDMEVAEDDSVRYTVAAWVDDGYPVIELGTFSDTLWAYADLEPNMEIVANLRQGEATTDTFIITWTPEWDSLPWDATPLNVLGAEDFSLYRGVWDDGEPASYNLVSGSISNTWYTDIYGEHSVGDTLSYYIVANYEWGEVGEHIGIATSDTVEVVAESAHSILTALGFWNEGAPPDREIVLAIYDDSDGALLGYSETITTSTGQGHYEADLNSAGPNTSIDVGTGDYIIAIWAATGDATHRRSSGSGANGLIWEGPDGAGFDPDAHNLDDDADPLPSTNTSAAWNFGSHLIYGLNADGDIILPPLDGDGDPLDISSHAEGDFPNAFVITAENMIWATVITYSYVEDYVDPR